MAVSIDSLEGVIIPFFFALPMELIALERSLIRVGLTVIDSIHAVGHIVDQLSFEIRAV